MGYDFDTLPRRTYAELNTLQLGWIGQMERQRDAENAAYSGHTTETERRKRQHKQDIARRLRTQ